MLSDLATFSSFKGSGRPQRGQEMSALRTMFPGVVKKDVTAALVQSWLNPSQSSRNFLKTEIDSLCESRMESM